MVARCASILRYTYIACIIKKFRLVSGLHGTLFRSVTAKCLQQKCITVSNFISAETSEVCLRTLRLWSVPKRKQWGEKRGQVTWQARRFLQSLKWCVQEIWFPLGTSESPAVAPSRRCQHKRLTSPALCNIVLRLLPLSSWLYCTTERPITGRNF